MFLERFIVKKNKKYGAELFYTFTTFFFYLRSVKVVMGRRSHSYKLPITAKGEEPNHILLT